MAMKKIFLAHGTDLARCKEPCQRDVAQGFVDQRGIRVGLTEKVAASAVATEQQSATGLPFFSAGLMQFLSLQ